MPEPDAHVEERRAESDEHDLGPNTGRWVVVGFVALLAAFIVYMALGMPGMDHGSGGGGMDHDMSEDMLPSMTPPTAP